jgi:UDP-glucose 4-epimerase
MILVIGGAGYIGSHMVKFLLESGEDPIVLDNLELGHRKAVLCDELIEGDIRDRALLHRLFEDRDIECVMHFAAYAAVGDSVENPAKYYDNNVNGCFQLLEAMRAGGVDKIIFSSSAATYGEPMGIPIAEDHPQQPTNPYGETKLVMERMLKWYHRAYGVRSVSLRYFNAAGADPTGLLGEDHDPEQHIIPVVLQTALGKREAVKVFGTDWDTPDGTCIRDYIHVTDLADAHLRALNALRGGADVKAYNLGNGEGFSVKQVVETCEKVVGRPIPSVSAPRRPGDPARLVASSARARAELGWSPKYADVETIVQHAWSWMQKHPDGYGD